MNDYERAIWHGRLRWLREPVKEFSRWLFIRTHRAEIEYVTHDIIRGLHYSASDAAQDAAIGAIDCLRALDLPQIQKGDG